MAKVLKKILIPLTAILCALITLFFVACGGDGSVPDLPPDDDGASNADSKTLVVYFSYSNNTKRLADYIAQKTGGDVVEIEAKIPYTSADTNYSNSNTRCETEMLTNARPEVAQSTYDKIDMTKYDAVFIGYPIWWWTAPMIIGTFLEHYEWTSDIDVYPFSQSASMNVSQFETSMELVRSSANGATVHDGLFARPADTTTIDGYLTANGF